MANRAWMRLTVLASSLIGASVCGCGSSAPSGQDHADAAADAPDGDHFGAGGAGGAGTGGGGSGGGGSGGSAVGGSGGSVGGGGSGAGGSASGGISGSGGGASGAGGSAGGTSSGGGGSNGGGVSGRGGIAGGGTGGGTAGGNAGGAGGGAGGGGGQTNCGVQTFAATGRDVDVLVVLDRSASMAEPPPSRPNDPTKWSQAVAALTQVSAATNATVSWGLKSFPEEGDECGSTSVTNAIDVPVTAMNATAVNAAIATLTPAGNGTPTSAALGVANAYLRTLTDANPKYLLLVTDGIPSCGGTAGAVTRPTTAVAAAAAVQAVAGAAANGMHTFVIGIEDNTTSVVDTLNMLAVAGGEPRSNVNPLATRFYQAQSTDELIAALRTITGGIVSCSFPLASPPPVPGNVSVSVAGTSIPRDPANTNGWNYTGAANTEVRVYGSWCETIRASTAASVQITYACTAGGAGGGAGTLLMSDDFEDGNADGWLTNAAGSGASWAVASDGANHVYQQSVSTADAWAAGGAIGWTDQRAEVRMKFPTVPASGAFAMVAARFQDLSNHYYALLASDGRVSIRKRIAGSVSTLVSNTNRTPPVAGTWYTLALAVQGTTLTAYLDGAAVAATVDSDLGAGGIALGTQNLTALFDDVKVTLP